MIALKRGYFTRLKAWRVWKEVFTLHHAQLTASTFACPYPVNTNANPLPHAGDASVSADGVILFARV